jgi:hypothetical protein
MIQDEPSYRPEALSLKDQIGKGRLALWLRAMSALGVRREKAALSSGCKAHPANRSSGKTSRHLSGIDFSERFGHALVQ